MEAAGTAVGIASLGIQTCQGLMSYYDDWKSYNSDISNTYDGITELSKTLTLLVATLEQDSLDKERAQRAKRCLGSCESALLALSDKWKSLQKHSRPDTSRRKPWSELRRLWYPFQKDTLDKLRHNVVDVQERLKLAVQVLQLETGIASQQVLVDLDKRIVDLGESVALQNQRVVDAQTSDEFRKIVSWLSPADPWTNHNSARQRHQSDTGDWLLQCKQYQRWKAGDIAHLWMHGKAGCGKTILCSTAVDDIQRYCQHVPNVACAVFYFSFSDEHKQTDEDFLCSLVAQLGWREPGLSMLQRAYGDPKRSALGAEELAKIFLAAIQSYDQVFLIMDALDECPEDHDIRQCVMERIKSLAHNEPSLKLFAVSRELEQIHDSMEALLCEPLHVTALLANADIKKYLSHELLHDRKFRHMDPDTRNVIETTIAARADGMFRWAYCQLQELKKLKSTKAKYIERALNTLPATLDETYARILLALEEMYHPEALTFLRWLAYSRSPPTLAALVEAAIVDPSGEPCVDLRNRGDLEDVLRILTGLVTVIGPESHLDAITIGNQDSSSEVSSTENDEVDFHSPYQRLSPNSRVRLAHFSVKEYLESKRILESDARNFHLDSVLAHKFLTESCLVYLEFYSNLHRDGDTPIHEDLGKFPLLHYAANGWFIHSVLQKSTACRREVSFLQSERARNAWLRHCSPDKVWLGSPQWSRSLDHPAPALYYASVCGLPAVVLALLDSGSNVNESGGVFGNALQAACDGGYVDIVTILLDHDADVNAQSGQMGNALQAASRRGSIDVVRLLVDRGADVHAKNGHYDSALQAAAYEGSMEVVDLLVSEGVDINSQGGELGNALQAASAEGHVDIVRFLLAHGADANLEGGHYGTALQAASWRGSLEVVNLLLDGGADVHARDGWHDSAASVAASKGHLSIIQALRDHGADLERRDQYGRTALAWAVIGGHRSLELIFDSLDAETSFRSLLDTIDVLGCSLIHYFAMINSSKGISMLLDAGADLNSADSHGWTALHWSAYFDTPDALLMLMRSGGNVDCRDHLGRSAYDVALFVAADSAVTCLGGQQNTLNRTPKHAQDTAFACDCCLRVRYPVPAHTIAAAD